LVHFSLERVCAWPQARELAMVLWATAAVGGPSQDLLAAAGREVRGRCMRVGESCSRHEKGGSRQWAQGDSETEPVGREAAAGCRTGLGPEVKAAWRLCKDVCSQAQPPHACTGGISRNGFRKLHCARTLCFDPLQHSLRLALCALGLKGCLCRCR
jgi:hypothetical protein